MKRKIFGVLIALLMVVSLGLVTVVPVSADALTGISATTDNSTAGATANYTIAFTTATSGNITTIDMAFATEFDVSGVTLGTVTGIGAGSRSVSGDNVTYTVSSPEVVAASVPVSIGLSNIVNPTASESYNITITIKDNFGVEIDSGTASVTINPGPLDHFFVVTEHAGTEVAGTAFSVNVTAQDQYDNTATSYNGTAVSITFTSTATSAPDTTSPTIPTSQSLDFSATPGIATATGFILVDAGETPTISASDGTYSGTSAAITVNPATAASLGVTDITDPITKGTSSNVTVTAYDEYENTATSYNGTIAFTSTDTAATLPSNYTFVPASDNGTHIFTGGVTFNTVGEQSVTATDTVTGTITGTQSSISVYIPVTIAPPVAGSPPVIYVEANLFSTELGFRIRSEGRSKGEILKTIEATSEDGLLSITIPKGTIALDKEGDPLEGLEAAVDESPPEPPKDSHIIGLTYGFSPEGATFDPPITLEYTYDPAEVPEGVAEEDLVIAYYDEDAGEWVECECTCNPETHCVTACVCHFTCFAIIGAVTLPPPPPPAPATFSVANLSVKPLEIKPNEIVTITASVANTGDTEGSYTVVLKINGVKEAEKSVTIAAGKSQDVSFSVAKEEAGSYGVVMDGLTGSFTVVAPVPPPPAPAPAPAPPAKPPINWPMIGAIIVATIVVGLLIFFLIRRRAA